MIEVFFYLFLIALPFAIPVLIIFLSVRKTKFFWLKPVYSAPDFLNELFALIAVFLFNILAWKTFFFFARDYSSGSIWPIELMFLGTILASLVYSFYIKSYSLSTLSVIAAFSFVVGEIIHWGVDSHFFISSYSSSYSPYVSPLVLITFSWLILNFLYPLAQYLKGFHRHARTGNLLRFFIISMNALLLGFLSNTFVANSWESIVVGQNIFVSWPLILVVLISVVLYAGVSYLLYKKGKSDTLKWELLASVLPISILFVVANITTFFVSEVRSYFNVYSSTELTPASIIWLAISNALFFIYLIYIVIKSAKTKELWLRIFAIVLLVCAVIYKFFDYFMNFTFRGIFFIVFGVILVTAVFIVQKFSKKSSAQ